MGRQLHAHVGVLSTCLVRAIVWWVRINKYVVSSVTVTHRCVCLCMVHEYAANIHLHIIFHSWNTYELFTTQKLQLLPILFDFIKLHLSLYQMYGTNSVATFFSLLNTSLSPYWSVEPRHRFILTSFRRKMPHLCVGNKIKDKSKQDATFVRLNTPYTQRQEIECTAECMYWSCISVMKKPHDGMNMIIHHVADPVSHLKCTFACSMCHYQNTNTASLHVPSII